MEPNAEKIAALARLVAATAPVELDCGEVLDLLAPYLEKGRGQAELSEELQRVKQHLAVCPECLEEFEALEKLADEGALGEE